MAFAARGCRHALLLLLLLQLRSVAPYETSVPPADPEEEEKGLQANAPKGGSKPRVPAGHNAADYCRACLHVVNELSESLLPELEKLTAKVEDVPKSQRYRRAAHFGNVDEKAEQQLERACSQMVVETSPVLKRSCTHIIEEHSETLVAAIAKWHKARRPASELRAALCARGARACTSSDLNLVGRRGLEKNINKTEFTSMRPPAINDGPVYVTVGATLNGTLNNHTDKDLIIHFSKSPRWDEVDERNARLEKMVARVAELLWALPRRPATLMFAKIDMARNDMVPPWDQLERSTILMLGAGREPILIGPGVNGVYRGLRTLEWLEPVELQLPEVLQQIIDGCNSDHSKRHVGNLAHHLGDERMHRDVAWWDDEVLLRRAREPYDSETKSVAASEQKDEI